MPSFITDKTAQKVYVAENYWNEYFTCADKVDTLDLEQAVASFSKLLKLITVKDAYSAVGNFSEGLENYGDSIIYDRLARLFEKYFFDPNSPVRDEDMYGVFAAARAESQFTPEDMREAYRADAAVCALNARESVAADFNYCTSKGQNGSLHKLPARKTLVVFNNPGCENCREVQTSLCNNGVIKLLVERGLLTVICVYVDEDLQEWRDHADLYPDNWINAYNPQCTIRNEQIYSLRAIPSLYLLDKDKRVILKDAPFNDILQRL